MQLKSPPNVFEGYECAHPADAIERIEAGCAQVELDSPALLRSFLARPGRSHGSEHDHQSLAHLRCRRRL